jgi:transcriptional regulator NrdR family protein
VAPINTETRSKLESAVKAVCCSDDVTGNDGRRSFKSSQRRAGAESSGRLVSRQRNEHALDEDKRDDEIAYLRRAIYFREVDLLMQTITALDRFSVRG